MSKSEDKNKVTKSNSNKPKTTNKSKASKSTTKKSSTTKKTINTEISTTKKRSAAKTTKKSSTVNKRNNSTVKTSAKPVKKKEDINEVLVEDIKKIDIEVANNEPVAETKQEIIEKEIIEEISNINNTKLENAKFTVRKRNKFAISIGVFISLLGVVALIITLIANRIIDREFISDFEIIAMVVISIVIEIMGAAIIVKET